MSRRPGQQRRINNGRRQSNRNKRKKNSAATVNKTQFRENDDQNQPRRRRRRGRGRRGRRPRVNPEERKMAKNSNLSVNAPRFNSAFEWKEPMFLSPFMTGSKPVFELNPDAAEFVPKNE